MHGVRFLHSHDHAVYYCVIACPNRPRPHRRGYMGGTPAYDVAPAPWAPPIVTGPAGAPIPGSFQPPIATAASPVAEPPQMFNQPGPTVAPAPAPIGASMSEKSESEPIRQGA